MHHAKLDRWFQLGGHCDGNPDVLAVAIKEAQEESGKSKELRWFGMDDELPTQSPSVLRMQSK